MDGARGPGGQGAGGGLYLADTSYGVWPSKQERPNTFHMQFSLCFGEFEPKIVRVNRGETKCRKTVTGVLTTKNTFQENIYYCFAVLRIRIFLDQIIDGQGVHQRMSSFVVHLLFQVLDRINGAGSQIRSTCPALTDFSGNDTL